MVALRQEEINHISGQIVSGVIERHGNVLQETIAGNKVLVEVAGKYIQCDSGFTQGRMFEIIEMTKFNQAAAKAGSLLRAVTTDMLGRPHDEADILIRDAQENVLREIQAKSGTKASNLANYIRDDKYTGMGRLVNIEHEERVRELVDKRIDANGIFTEQYNDVRDNLQGKLNYDGISSKGTTYDEAKYAAENAGKYAQQSNINEVISGASTAMLSGALAGAFVGGSITAATGFFKKDFCVKETGKAAVSSAARSSVIGGVSYGLKYVGKNNPIMKGNVVSAIASSAVSLTETTYRYLTGKISTEEFVENIGENAVSCLSGIVLTAAGGLLFGPIGAAVAGTVSLMAMKQLHKVFMSARADLALAKEARLEAEKLAEIFFAQIKEEEKILVAYYEEFSETLKDMRHLVDLAITDNQYTEQAIVSMAKGLNVKFQFDTIEKFSDFMMSDEDLIL